MIHPICEKLSEVIRTYGISICDDPARCEAILRDMMPGNSKEVFLLVNALRAGAVKQLILPTPVSNYNITIAKIIKNLESNFGLTHDAAKWSVESWAIALGIIDEYIEDTNTSPIDNSTQIENLTSSKVRVPNEILSGTLLNDHTWHLLGKGEHPNWLQDNRFLTVLQRGTCLDDGVFDYRMDTNTSAFDISLKSCFNQHFYNKYRSYPTDVSKKVHFGSVIADRYWHPLDYSQLYDGLKRPAVKLELNKGSEWSGKVFVYRRNFGHERYEVRVRDDIPIPQEYHRPK